MKKWNPHIGDECFYKNDNEIYVITVIKNNMINLRPISRHTPKRYILVNKECIHTLCEWTGTRQQIINMDYANNTL